jgi:hypothetical protein
LAKIKILSEDMYDVRMEKMTMAGVVLSGPHTALLDSGNTLISIPAANKSALFEGFYKAGIKCKAKVEDNRDFFQIGCNVPSKDKIPDIQVMIEGVTFTVKGKDLIDKCSSNGFIFTSSYDCMLNIEIQNNASYVILGKSFLASTYSTFFLDRREIWLSQPGADKYKALIAKNKAHGAANSHMGRADNGLTPDPFSEEEEKNTVWTTSDFERMRHMAE